MSFGICIVKNPVLIFDERRQCEVINWDESQGDRVLNFDFDAGDFEELQKFLDIKLLPAKQRQSESYSAYDERIKNEYLEAAKEKSFEMLGRFGDWYNCVTYFSSEIAFLKEECLRVKNNSKSQNLTKAVNKILAACDEAVKTNSGLEFASD